MPPSVPFTVAPPVYSPAGPSAALNGLSVLNGFPLLIWCQPHPTTGASTPPPRRMNAFSFAASASGWASGIVTTTAPGGRDSSSPYPRNDTMRVPFQSATARATQSFIALRRTSRQTTVGAFPPASQARHSRRNATFSSRCAASFSKNPWCVTATARPLPYAVAAATAAFASFTLPKASGTASSPATSRHPGKQPLQTAMFFAQPDSRARSASA